MRRVLRFEYPAAHEKRPRHPMRTSGARGCLQSGNPWMIAQPGDDTCRGDTDSKYPQRANGRGSPECRNATGGDIFTRPLCLPHQWCLKMLIRDNLVLLLWGTVKRLSPIALLVLAMTGCSSVPTSSEILEETPSPTASASSEVSVERWAGIVAEQQLTLDDWSQKWDGNSCSALSIEFPLCGAALLSGSYISQTMHITIWGPTVRGGNTYLGTVPAEIEDLYAETIELTEEAKVAGEAWQASTCSADASGEGCTSLAFTLENALGAVKTKFAAWAPYL